MPTAREYLAVGAVNGILYALGGLTVGSYTAVNTVEAFDPTADTWSTKAPMPTAREQLGVAAVNGILYAVGGFPVNNYVPLNTVEAYDPQTNTWSPKASMPTARGGLAVGVVNGILYAVGGHNGSNVVNAVEAYNPSTDKWTPVASMLTPQYLLGAGVVNGILYAVGGVNCTSIACTLSTNEAFAPPFFAAFFAALDITPASGSFQLRGFFALGAGQTIDPLTQEVTAQVGSYSVIIPAGSFHRDRRGNFVFDGTINGVTLQADVTPVGGKNYFFAVKGAGAPNLPTQNPVTVGLTIGDNGRSANVQANFH